MKQESASGKHMMALLIGSFILALTLPARAETAPAAGGATTVPTGRWLTASGNLEVEIAACGDALCGTVVRVLSNRSMSNPAVEIKPDAPPALGMKILSDFTRSGDGEWKGHIYNRENGKTYRCLMTLLGPEQLKLRPYVGVSLFGKDQVWQRVPAATGQK